MIFLANENVPFKSVTVMREKGIDVKCVSELYPGISDIEVISLAKKEQRIILTFDKDYGYLLYKEGLAFKEGLVFIRFIPGNPAEAGKILVKLISKGVNLTGYFTVVYSNSIRQRPLKGNKEKG